MCMVRTQKQQGGTLMCTSLPHVENEARENFSTEDIIMILQMILSEEEIYALANECHVCLRKRKFDVRAFIVAAIKCFLNGKQDITLRLLKVLYLEDSDTSISYTAIQNQLAKDSFADFIKKIRDKILKSAIEHCVLDIPIKNLMDFLYESLGIKSIIGQDGTCIAVKPGCRITMGASTMGKTKADGKPAQPTLKAHLSIDESCNLLACQTTSSAAKGVGEISQTFPENYSNAIFISDRGYSSADHFRNCSKNENYFLIKSKINACPTCVSINYDSMKPKNYVNRKLKDINPRHTEIIDINCLFSNGEIFRVIKFDIGKNKCNKNIIALVTNIPYDKMKSEALINLYRYRWRTCEIPNKCLKSDNCLKGINSRNPNIVNACFDLAYIAYTLKNIFISILKKKYIENHGYDYKIRNACFSLIKIHRHATSSINHFFNGLIHAPQNFYEWISDFAENKLFKFFAMESTSKRDKDKKKDVRILIQEILPS